MKTKAIVVILSIIIPGILLAQTDTSELKEILLKEVIIHQGAIRTTNDMFTPDKDVQKGTDQILNTLSGISIIKRGNYAWEPGIRGFSAGQITTTIDGMAIFGACTDRMDPVSSYIEPVNLKSMAISYSNNGSMAGNTIGGGLDFKVKQPSFSKTKTFSGMASAGYESNGNAAKTSASVNFGTARLGININGTFRSSGNYRAGGREEIKFSQYTKWNGGLGVKYKINQHQSVWLNYIKDEGYNIGYPALTMDVLFAKADIVSLTHQIHLSNSVFNRIESKAYFNYINHAMDDTKRPADQVFMHMDMPGTSRTAGFNLTATGAIKNHQIKTGINLYENRLQAEMTMYPSGAAPMFMLTLPDAKRQYAEINVHDEWQIHNKLVIQTSASGSVAESSIFTEEGKQTISAFYSGKSRRTDFLPTFSVTPVYRLHPKASVFVSAGYTMRTPALQELYGFYLFNRADNYDYLGNPGLKNESSLNLSAGINLKGEKFKATTRLFSYFMNNYITGIVQEDMDKMTNSASGVKQYQNLGSAHLIGFETDMTWNLNKQLSLESSNSFSYGEDLHGDALPLIPPFKSINRVNLSIRQFNLQPEAVFRASQNRISQSYGETKTPASLILNFQVQKSFKVQSKIISANVEIENILDTKYYDHNDIMKILRMGRSVGVQVTYYF